MYQNQLSRYSTAQGRDRAESRTRVQLACNVLEEKAETRPERHPSILPPGTQVSIKETQENRQGRRHPISCLSREDRGRDHEACAMAVVQTGDNLSALSCLVLLDWVSQLSYRAVAFWRGKRKIFSGTFVNDSGLLSSARPSSGWCLDSSLLCLWRVKTATKY